MYQIISELLVFIAHTLDACRMIPHLHPVVQLFVYMIKTCTLSLCIGLQVEELNASRLALLCTKRHNYRTLYTQAKFPFEMNRYFSRHC